MIKTIPKKKKCTKTKCLFEEALQTAEKRREAKGKGEKERYTHLNAEFQRIARRDKKPSSVINAKKQSKTIERERLEISSRKLRDTKRNFHAKMSTIKDTNGTDLTEAEEIKKRWQEYTEEPYKTGLQDPDKHDGVVPLPEPDTLECEGKQALGSISRNKAGGGGGAPAEPLQILKDDAVKVLRAICQHIWKTQQQTQDWKTSVFIPIPKEGTTEECSNYRTVALISPASKVVLKILQVRFQQYVNRELPNVQAGFRKGRGTRDQTANIRWITEKKTGFHKNICFGFIDCAKACDCVDHNKV